MHALAVLLQAQPDIQAFQRIMAVMVPVMIFAYLFVVALVMVPCWFICKKAGFSPWLSLLNIVPFGNLILIYVLAFADWKVMPVPPQAYWPPQPPYQPPPVPPAPTA